jgi:hypothetical protein
MKKGRKNVEILCSAIGGECSMICVFVRTSEGVAEHIPNVISK